MPSPLELQLAKMRLRKSPPPRSANAIKSIYEPPVTLSNITRGNKICKPGYKLDSLKRCTPTRKKTSVRKTKRSARSGRKRSGRKKTGPKRSGRKRSGPKKSGRKRTGRKRTGPKKSGRKRSGRKAKRSPAKRGVSIPKRKKKSGRR